MWKKLKSLEVNCLAFVFSGWHCASAALSFNSADLNQHSKKQIKRQHHTCAWYYFQFCMLKWSWTMFGGNTISSNYLEQLSKQCQRCWFMGSVLHAVTWPRSLPPSHALCHPGMMHAPQPRAVSPGHTPCHPVMLCVTWPCSMPPSHVLCHAAILHVTHNLQWQPHAQCITAVYFTILDVNSCDEM